VLLVMVPHFAILLWFAHLLLQNASLPKVLVERAVMIMIVLQLPFVLQPLALQSSQLEMVDLLPHSKLAKQISSSTMDHASHSLILATLAVVKAPLVVPELFVMLIPVAASVMFADQIIQAPHLLVQMLKSVWLNALPLTTASTPSQIYSAFYLDLEVATTTTAHLRSIIIFPAVLEVDAVPLLSFWVSLQFLPLLLQF